MKLYAITLKPLSGFGTPLKGDTLFGHFCWQVAYDPSLVEGGLEVQLARYPDKPFTVFSSAFPSLTIGGKTSWFLKRPDLPFSFLMPRQESRLEDLRRKKDFKVKKWMRVEDLRRLQMRTAEFLDDQELFKRSFAEVTHETRRQVQKADDPMLLKTTGQPHNTINRLTQTTGTGLFAPYTAQNYYYLPETELVIFALIEETATDIERLTLGLERMGAWGYGRDASIGLGRFEVCDREEISLPVLMPATACYTLAPCVPVTDDLKDAFFTPFVRFGKHGDRLACQGNPFKNPVIMADEGAVLIPKNNAAIQKPYVGRAVTHVSKALPNTVVQGFAPWLPLEMEIP